MKEIKLWRVSSKNAGDDCEDIYFTNQASANKYCRELTTGATVSPMEVIGYKNVTEKYYVFVKPKLLPVTVRRW